MADLYALLSELDGIERPDLWGEVERRATADPTISRPTGALTVTSAARPTWRKAMLSVSRVLTVVAVAALSTGLVALSLRTTSPDAGSAPDPGSAPASGSPASGSPAPGSPAPRSPAPGSPAPAIIWDSGSVRLEADSLEIRAGDAVFTGQAPFSVRSATGSPDRRTLEVEWTEDGLEQRLYLYLAADDRDWWVTEIRTRDGHPNADWLYYDEFHLLAATPRGETYEGGLHLRGGRSEREDRDVRGELSIIGLRLTAFEPGSGPAELTGCEHVRASMRLQADPLDEGQPLAGSGIEDMTPAQAEAYLREQGICFTFRYLYHTSEDKSEGYGERWCTAPPAGLIGELAYTDDDGEVVVFVHDDRVLPLREQPPPGWGCPAG